MKKAIAWSLCALWMGVIFMMSAAPGDVSSAQSSLVTQLVLRALSYFPGGADVPADHLEHVVRKGAHMAEYAVLFLLYARALRLSGAKRPSFIAFILSVLYAATDEFHQGFTAGRAPMLSDVGIDAIGAGIGWLMRAAYGRIRRKIETQKD